MYDYLVVGSGLYEATFAHEAHQHGKSVLVIDKRPNIAGNIYTEKVEGINFHKQVFFADPTAVDLANRSPIARQVLSTRKIETLGWQGAFTVNKGIEHTLKILCGE